MRHPFLTLSFLLAGTITTADSARTETLAFNTPAGLQTCVNPGNPVNLGLRFTANAAVTVDGLGWFYDPSCSGNYAGDQEVAIYSDVGDLIVKITVPAPSLTPPLPSQGYQIQSITPIELVSGQTYRVVTHTGYNAWGYGTANGADALITFREQYYKYSGTLAFTTDTAGSAGVYAGPNMRLALATTTLITDVTPSPVDSEGSYTVSGTVTVPSRVPDPGSTPPGVSAVDLPGKVAVSGDGNCEDTTVSPGDSTGVYDFSCSLTAGTAGTKSLKATYSGEGFQTSEGTGSQEVTAVSAVACEGLFAPVDRRPTVNRANAGRSIPLKWRCTQNGVPVVAVPPGEFALMSQPCVGSVATSTLTDPIEEYSVASGLINQGDGYWQFNWVTPKTYANSCHTVTVTFMGQTLSADVQFVR